MIIKTRAVAMISSLILGVGTAVATAEDSNGPVSVYVTAKDSGERIAKAAGLSFAAMPQPNEQEACIFIDPAKEFQTLLGIGGALTDAAAETLAKLPADKQDEILRAYYDPHNGLGYSLGRTHINSCDFSSESYTYVKDGDTALGSFDIAHDRLHRLPMIKKALALAGKDFRLFASPWSPPAWMKDNHDMLHGGKLKPEFYDAWASYYVKFIQAYQKEGIPIWGLTVQNEPMANQTWESCNYTAQDEREFVKNHLGPNLAKAGLADKKIMIWDHNRNMMYQQAQAVLDDPAAAKYVWGVAFHWYSGDNFDNVRRLQEAYPKINTLLTEACVYPFNLDKCDEWHWGETYGKSMINDFNNGAVGWTDWNILVDELGGPNHVQNYCFAPVIGDTRNGQVHYMNSFYYIGHFSKFIRPGARRIASSSMVDALSATAFANPDGKIAVVVMNATDTIQPFFLWMQGHGAKTTSPAHSIMTLIIPSSTAASQVANSGNTAAASR